MRGLTMIDDGAPPNGEAGLGPGARGALTASRERAAGRTILVADASPFVRDGLIAVIRSGPELTVTDTARDAGELCALAADRRPQVIVASVELLAAHGVLEALRALPDPAAVVGLLDRLPDPRTAELYAAGLHAVLPKEASREELLAVVRSVLRGQRVVPPDVQRALDSETTPMPLPALTRGAVDPGVARHDPTVLGGGSGGVTAVSTETESQRMFVVVSAFRFASILACGVLWATGALRIDVAPIAAASLLVGLAAATFAALWLRAGARPHTSLALGVDVVLAAALTASAHQEAAGVVLLCAVLPLHALRVDPVRLAVAVPLAVVALAGAVAVAPNPPSTAHAAFTLTMLLLSGVGAVMLSSVRRRGQRERHELKVLRQELLRESLAAERRGRRRLAEELHDDPLQLLLVARQDLEEMGEDPELLSSAQTTLDAATVRFRELMYDGARTPPIDSGLRETLSELCAQRAARGRFTWSVTVSPGLDHVDDELVVALVQELVTNVVKHARASQVAVSVRRRRRTLLVDVVDDGVGLSETRRAEAAAAGHLGLTSLHRRVRAAGGRWEVGPGEDGGTAIRISLPAPERAELPA